MSKFISNRCWLETRNETLRSESKFIQITTETDSTFLVFCFSWLLEYVSSSMSESPLSEYSSSLGTSGTLGFLVLGGKAGGVASTEGLLSAGRDCAAAGPSVGMLRWNPLRFVCWRPMFSVLESCELTLPCRTDWGGDVLLEISGGLGERVWSSEEELTSNSWFWAADLEWWIPKGESKREEKRLVYGTVIKKFFFPSKILVKYYCIVHISSYKTATRIFIPGNSLSLGWETTNVTSSGEHCRISTTESCDRFSRLTSFTLNSLSPAGKSKKVELKTLHWTIQNVKRILEKDYN